MKFTNQYPRHIRAVLDVIKYGVSPRLLPTAWRPDCVAALIREGHSIAEIASFFDRSQKAIKRDLQNVSKSNSLRFVRDFERIVNGKNKKRK